MKKLPILCSMIFAASSATAEDLTGVTEMVCSAGQAQICFETGECFASSPWELNIPEFFVIDTEQRTVRTTKSNPQSRSTSISRININDRSITLQGVENWAFSLVIDIVTGRITGAIARDGMTVSVYGACTGIDV